MKTSTKHSRAGKLEWMMLCNEASDIRTRTSESFLRNGSRRFSTKLSGRSHNAKVAVWREEENARWTSVLRAQVDGVRYLVGDFQGNSRTQAVVVLRIQGISARHPSCRAWYACLGSMTGCRGFEWSPGGRR